jgi:long-chain acyl-CoA synthetase
LITFGWINAIKKLFTPEPLRTVPVNDDESHRVDPRFRGNLAVTPRDGVETLYDLAKDAFKRYGARHCMGYRKFLGWKVPNKVKHFDTAITFKSFADVGADAHKFGAALRKCGIVPANDTTTLSKVETSSRIAIFENTCADWMVAAMGAFSQSATVVTVYATLGIDAVVEAVTENAIAVLVCNRRNVQVVAEQSNKMPSLTTIVFTNDLIAPEENVAVPESSAKLKIMSFQEFVDSGDTTAFPPTPPKKDTIAVIMYTSGMFVGLLL